MISATWRARSNATIWFATESVRNWSNTLKSTAPPSRPSRRPKGHRAAAAERQSRRLKGTLASALPLESSDQKNGFLRLCCACLRTKSEKHQPTKKWNRAGDRSPALFESIQCRDYFVTEVANAASSRDTASLALR